MNKKLIWSTNYNSIPKITSKIVKKIIFNSWIEVYAKWSIRNIYSVKTEGVKIWKGMKEGIGGIEFVKSFEIKIWKVDLSFGVHEEQVSNLKK